GAVYVPLRLLLGPSLSRCLARGRGEATSRAAEWPCRRLHSGLCRPGRDAAATAYRPLLRCRGDLLRLCAAGDLLRVAALLRVGM
ncbi:unnamed protein product, partial [Symbiodinium sp. CCMP2456]